MRLKIEDQNASERLSDRSGVAFFDFWHPVES